MDDGSDEGLDYANFEYLKTLGKGTHGTVILVQCMTNKKKYAIKSIKKKSFNDDKQLTLIKREIEIMSSLCHPHIITVHDVCESNSRVTMTMEYASGGELFDYVNDSPGGLDDREVLRLFNQITSAVCYMHRQNNVVHRDLKLENILLDSKKNAKVADFGLANMFSRDKLLFTYCGSPLYASPEIVKAQPYFGPEVDCWSLGVILYAMSFGCMPFDGSNATRLKKSIIQGDYAIPYHAHPSLSDLINGLLEPDSNKRLTVKQIINHPWCLSRYDDDDDDDGDDDGGGDDGEDEVYVVNGHKHDDFREDLNKYSTNHLHSNSDFNLGQHLFEGKTSESFKKHLNVDDECNQFLEKLERYCRETPVFDNSDSLEFPGNKLADHPFVDKKTKNSANNFCDIQPPSSIKHELLYQTSFKDESLVRDQSIINCSNYKFSLSKSPNSMHLNEKFHDNDVLNFQSCLGNDDDDDDDTNLIVCDSDHLLQPSSSSTSSPVNIPKPIICEIKSPKKLSISHNVGIICDLKTSSLDNMDFHFNTNHQDKIGMGNCLQSSRFPNKNDISYLNYDSMPMPRHKSEPHSFSVLKSEFSCDVLVVEDENSILHSNNLKIKHKSKYHHVCGNDIPKHRKKFLNSSCNRNVDDDINKGFNASPKFNGDWNGLKRLNDPHVHSCVSDDGGGDNDDDDDDDESLQSYHYDDIDEVLLNSSFDPKNNYSDSLLDFQRSSFPNNFHYHNDNVDADDNFSLDSLDMR